MGSASLHGRTGMTAFRGIIFPCSQPRKRARVKDEKPQTLSDVTAQWIASNKQNWTPVLFRHQPLVHAGKASRPYPVGRGARPRGRVRRHPFALHRPDRHRYSNHRVVRATLEHRSHIRGVASSPWRRNPTAMVGPSHRSHYPLSLRSVFTDNSHGHPAHWGRPASRCAKRLVPQGASNLLRRHSFCTAQIVGCSVFCRLIGASSVHRIQPEPCKSVTRLPFGSGLIGQSREFIVSSFVCSRVPILLYWEYWYL